MPKVAILSDIHGNLHALRAVLREVGTSGAKLLAVAGDIIGYGANPRECVDLLQKVGAQAVFGNHEFYADRLQRKGRSGLEADWQSKPVSAGIVHALGELSARQMRWLLEFPWVQHIAKNTVMAHAALDQPEEWPYLESDQEARPTLDLMQSKGIELAFFGHTHRQEWFAHPDAAAQPEHREECRLRLPEGTICAVTVGAVGQPRGEDGDIRASWVLWDSDSRVIEFRKTSYPADLAAKAIRDAGLPEESAARLLKA